MSKKELLERIARAPADPKAKRPEGVPVPVGASGDSAVTTRVSGRVVRRRHLDAPEAPPVVAPPVVRRRQALELGQEAAEATEERSARPHDDGAPDPARAASEVDAPQEAPVEAAEPVEAKAREPEAHKAPAHEAKPARQERQARPEPVDVDSAAPVEAAAKPAREGRSSRGGDRAARPEPVRAAARPEPEAHAEPVRAPVEEAPAKGLPERPRFEGLGTGVVVPPPGYDPTNPGAFRRRVQQQQTAPGGRTPAATPPAGEDFRGRGRRVEGAAPEGESAEDRGRRQRRGRTATSVGEGPMAMRRRPRRKVSGQKAVSPGPKASKRRIRIDNVISVGQLAHELGVKAAIVVKELMQMGRMATVNEMLDMDTASLVAAQFEYEVVNAGFQEEEYLQQGAQDEVEEGAILRPPVVTIMGHVDHGKTTLLDAIRSAKVAAGEAGGITQHIGAYQVELDDQRITFIDTPGHAAFTAMRARGASVTDIVVLVVAADDGVQAQTSEAIAHAKAADVPIVVAINKMDRPGVSVDPIKTRLSEQGLQPDDWGGDTMYVPVSALKKQGIDELLEAILLQAEVLELRANPERKAEGMVIEARVERGRGPVATLLVQRGTLARGDNLVLGSAWGRVRAMLDHTGTQLKEAGPSTPVEIFGLSELPEVGDPFVVVKSEKDARTVAEHRGKEKREAGLFQPGRRTQADLFAQAEALEKKTLPVILKADVQGSLEALKTALQQIAVEGTELRVLHAQVGDISESDVNLAAANGSLLIGFNVRIDAMARQAAESQGVVPEMYEVIYAVLDRVMAQMGGLLGPRYDAVKQGAAEVRQIFNISKIGRVAGSYVTEGKVARGHTIRVFRDGTMLWEGKLGTLKRFKEDVREVAASYECGIGLDGFDTIEVGDTLESWSQEEIRRPGATA